MLDKNYSQNYNLTAPQIYKAKLSMPNFYTASANTSPAFGKTVSAPTSSVAPLKTKLKTPQEQQMMAEISANLGKKEQANLNSLLKTGKLLSNNSNDGSTTLTNLYKITKEPRLQGLDSNKVLSETINTLANPCIINQNFGKIPDFLLPQILENQKKLGLTQGLGLNNKPSPHFNAPQISGPTAAINPKDMDVVSSGTCVAASIEFNLANKKPAEYARYVAGLTSPEMCVKTRLNYKDIASNIITASNTLKAFKTEHSINPDSTIDVVLSPDNNSIIRARVQEDYKQAGSRSSIDSLMQSTFMNIGSGGTYDSLTDKRGGEDVDDDKGLIEQEKNYTESIVDNNGGKTSLTFQTVDDNSVLKGYTQSFEKTKKHLLDSLNAGSNVIIGFTEVDEKQKIVGGHEITIIGQKTNKQGELIFICNDTDDNKDEPVEIPAKILIPKIHHAGIPNKVLSPEEIDTDLDLVREFENLRNQNKPKEQVQNKQVAK